MIAILLHKGAAGVSLGISMFKTFPNDKMKIYILLLMFALFTPTGVAIGWVISKEGGSDSPLTEIVFCSFAAGTFLYISC